MTNLDRAIIMVMILVIWLSTETIPLSKDAVDSKILVYMIDSVDSTGRTNDITPPPPPHTHPTMKIRNFKLYYGVQHILFCCHFFNLFILS